MAGMPGRRNKALSLEKAEDIRQAIRVREVLDKLHLHVLGPAAAELGQKPEPMTDSQLKVALVLLNKCVPDLQAITVEADVNHTGTIQHRAVQEISGRVVELLGGRDAGDSTPLLPQ